MERTIKNIYCRKAIAFILMLAVLLGTIPLPGHNHMAYAAQQNSYHDPAEHWMNAINRTNELDANAVVTHETFYCAVCKKATSFSVWRTPEYTRNGMSALSRNVLYSDGTMVGGEGMGSILDGTPGVDAYYTGYHWTKCACDVCGTMNCDSSVGGYSFNKNVYILYDCAAEFMEDLEETVRYEYADGTYHHKIIKGGEYCVFCYGTRHTDSTVLECHTMKTDVLPQIGNGRFAIVEHCTVCDYQKTAYAAAKSVVADYYGVVDGQPHTITVSDLSEANVLTSIRYGYTANGCNLTSAPNFTEEGQYTVYYEVTYKYDTAEMVESGVAYVWLRDDREDESGCTCGCDDPNCNCQKPNCGGNCCGGNPCGDNHNFSLIESVAPSCLALGYDRYLCINCGKTEKRDYVDSLGHAMQQIVIRDATCEVDGKILNICVRCGLAEVEYTPKGEHKYATYSVAPTCTSPGYTVKECSVCGDRHITDMTEALPHNYEAHIVQATCTTGGQTTYICDGCGSSFVSDHTEALGHAWDEGRYLIEPTCADNGLIEYTCTRCGLTRREGANGGLSGSCADLLHGAHTVVAATSPVKAPVMNMAANSMLSEPVESVVNAASAVAVQSAASATGHVAGPAATCTTPQTCLVCGAVIADALGHHFWRETTQPTCTTMGYTTYNCINCNVSYKSDYMDAKGHNYIEEVTVPTCTEAGQTKFICRDCGDSHVGNYREAAGHKWDKGIAVVGSTCNGAGMTEYRCLNCNEVRLETEDANGHMPGAEATCTEPQLCTVCGAVLANAKGHSIEENVVAPTCTEIGYTEAVCKDCGLSYKTEYTNALGHSYDKEVTAATCTEQGYMDYACKRCGDSYTADYTEAAGHNWNTGTQVVNATCGGEGMTEYRCLNCNEIRLETEDAFGHDPGAEATCTEPQLCTVCGAVLEKALGHKYEKTVTDPTCTEMGYTTYTCSNCKDSYKEDYTKAAGHAVGDWQIVEQPTTAAEGSKEQKCTKCGQVVNVETIEKIYNQAVTDAKGEANVGKYLVTVLDTNTKNPIAGATVSLYADKTMSVMLPNNRLLDFTAQTTVKVQLKETNDDLKAVSAMVVSVTDKNDNYAAGKTDTAGQLTVPSQSKGTTNTDGRVTLGYTDIKGNKQTLTVKVVKEETNRPVKDAAVSVGSNGSVSVKLPAGVDMDDNNHIGVTATDQKKQAQAGLEVVVRSDLGKTAKGETDKGGKVVVPTIEVEPETERHGAYIVGYEDGSFRPEAQMTRAEAAAIFARLLAEAKGENISSARYAGFTDTVPGAWYGLYVDYLSSYGVVMGNSKTAFRPNDDITRAELTAMAVRFFEVTEDAKATDGKGTYAVFNDLPGSHWAAAYIENAAMQGWVQGYGNGSFRADARITRAEAVTLINNLLDRSADEEYISNNARKLNSFTDIYAKHWAYGAVMEAANGHIAVLENDGEAWKR